jgi:hypothetical protein
MMILRATHRFRLAAANISEARFRIASYRDPIFLEHNAGCGYGKSELTDDLCDINDQTYGIAFRQIQRNYNCIAGI